MRCTGDICNPQPPSRSRRRKRGGKSWNVPTTNAFEDAKPASTSLSSRADAESWADAESSVAASNSSTARALELRSPQLNALSVLSDALKTYRPSTIPLDTLATGLVVEDTNPAGPTAVLAAQTPDVCEGQTVIKPAGIATSYVYTGQTCPSDHAGACDPVGAGFVGMVRKSDADCPWFEADRPAGYNQFYYYDEDGSDTRWPNTYPGNSIPGPEELTIVNGMKYCAINDISFGKQYDGLVL